MNEPIFKLSDKQVEILKKVLDYYNTVVLPKHPGQRTTSMINRLSNSISRKGYYEDYTTEALNKAYKEYIVNTKNQ